MRFKDVDVVVVGGGHAGVEAANAAARAGVQVALVTLEASGIGAMSCNPAIGGLGKGHLVREVDALGGVMGRIADQSAIQFRLLNRRKGPAVQGPRAQIDRSLYKAAMQDDVAHTPNLSLIEAEVSDLLMRSDQLAGVQLADGRTVEAATVVLTTGTFLRGRILIGDVAIPAGRMGERSSVDLARRLEAFGLPLGRLKTGTPPRLDGKTIDWDVLEMQSGDTRPEMFSFLSREPVVQQLQCGIARTNEKTHEIIRRNLHLSAMYGGQVESVGPRYCPSVEDKVVRFAERTSHQLFLEPEGLDTDTVYPNGLSTSLPESVQHEMVRSVIGLEEARIIRPGYAIEYDFVDPRCLRATLELQSTEGLFLAGQINGTTGYEEAAGQGLVAGLNAAFKASGRDAVTFQRSDSYIGVMIDDLVTRGVTEPYRMFTSRAEYRLSLRADNADQRLTPLAMKLGILCDRRKEAFSRKKAELDRVRARMEQLSLTSAQARDHGMAISQDGKRRTALELLAYQDVDIDWLSNVWPELANIPDVVALQIERDAVYASLIPRQQRDVEAVRKDENIRIPADLDYGAIRGLSWELCFKLRASRPETLGQASRIEGMTPAALTQILVRIRQLQRKQVA